MSLSRWALALLTASCGGARTDLRTFDAIPQDAAAGDPIPGDPAGDPHTGDPTVGDPGNPCTTDSVWTEDAGMCIDRWEASNSAGAAASAAGATPWVNVTWSGAHDACELAGKTLCPSNIWLAACTGPGANTYPYGDTYDPEACNGFEHSNPVPRADTGSYPGCEGGYPGLFDMSGNVEEWTDTCSAGSCDLAVSSVTTGAAQMACGAIVSMGQTELEDRRGFRCCYVP